LPAAKNVYAIFPVPKIPLATITSTFLAPAGKDGSSTGIDPANVDGTIVPVGTPGAVSFEVVIKYPGDQSLSCPSEYDQ
jgi:hypothetical protein